ncbi:hypothetical protein [Priestia filamentosa]|uniref:hypothetical protein n=1 Tax=Priestia filamentosa TaxID=1402861 RepID=UPI000A090539|nr:hypothetical protein [Priestia filamentosa]OXS67244.1 hypothetical protein B1B01_17280 [Priestia filamentosa]SMF53600.1 hypothetical protein SAMN06296056_104248 [Priestia filamentosa]
MNNIDRLKMEIEGFELPDERLTVHLEENELMATGEYNAQSKTNKRNIYKAALSVLESMANNPNYMKNYKVEDTSVSYLHNNLMKRIDDLQRKIRVMATDEDDNENGFFMLFS